MKKISLFMVVFMCIKISFAGHLIGGEMSYKYLGNDNYEITLKLYRDCLSGQAGYDNPTNIFIFNSSGYLVTTMPIFFPGSDTLSLVSNCGEPLPPWICIEEASFIGTINLPPAQGGYTMVYQRCCHTYNIANLLNPDQNGSTFSAFIPDSSLTTSNNSPVFNNEPPFVVCYNVPISYDHSANDADGDSLVYELCAAISGATQFDPYPNPALPPPYVSLIYISPYSAAYPMNANPGLAIDQATGMLTGTPAAIGTYTLSFCVNEYRDGNLLSVHQREFIVNVIEGNPNAAEEVLGANSIRIFPNPANESAQVKLESISEGIQEIKLFNQLGETIQVITSLSHVSEVNLDLHDLPNGIYCVRVWSNQLACSRTLLISR